MTDNPWRTMSSRKVYESPWVVLREDQVIRPDGQSGIYSVLELPQSVGVVAIDHAGRVALVRQWRYPHQRIGIEIPTGGSTQDDESIVDAARRELREETGLTAEEWTGLGQIENSNGATNDVAHIFLARRLTSGPKQQDGTEQVELTWLPYHDAVRLAMTGEIRESTSVAALLKTELLRRDGAWTLPTEPDHGV